MWNWRGTNIHTRLWFIFYDTIFLAKEQKIGQKLWMRKTKLIYLIICIIFSPNSVDKNGRQGEYETSLIDLTKRFSGGKFFCFRIMELLTLLLPRSIMISNLIRVPFNYITSNCFCWAASEISVSFIMRVLKTIIFCDSHKTGVKKERRLNSWLK